MKTSFYYADTNSQPVGPLSIEEIRQFVAAGVIPPDVLICEADGEEWRELDHLATPSGPPHRSQEAPSPLPSPQPKAVVARSLGAYFNNAVCATVAFIVLNFISFGATTEPGAGTESPALSLFVGLTTIWAVIAEAMLIYKLCCTLPSPLLFSTPAKATGFLFIPGFHFYWAFVLFPGLASAVLRWREQESIPGRQPSWILSLGYVVAFLFGATSILSLLETIGSIPQSDPAQLFYVLECVLRLSFYSTIIGQMHLILGPGSKPRHVSLMLTDTAKLPRPLVWGCNVFLPVVSGVILLIMIIVRLLGAVIP